MTRFTIVLNTTTRPVGYDYARVLHDAAALECFISAFPRRRSAEIAGHLGSKAVFCDTWQTAFLLANRLSGPTRFTRFLSHVAKVKLDRCTLRNLGNAGAAVFYSGAGLETIRVCRKRGILSVCQVHHSHVLELERILKDEAATCSLPHTPVYSSVQVQRQLQEFAEADVILCPSEAVMESFARAGTPEAKLIVVPHGTDLRVDDAVGGGIASRGRPLRILYVGQLHYRKGLRFLAEALQVIASDQMECRLVGPDFGLSGLDMMRGPKNLLRIGPKKGADLQREYREADVFVLPSLEDGFGLVVLEAMRAMLPVVITSAVGAKGFVTDGVEGWIVPPGDPASLAEKLVWMQAHPVERLAMGLAAERRAREAGGWAVAAHCLVDSLREKALSISVS